MGAVGFDDSYRNYPNIWNQYQIEVVSETDSVSDFWFTEKTANCLATGKPFALVSGQYSLHRLRNMGFTTFESVLDESYDTEPTPYKRITRLTDALNELYNSPDRSDRIQELYRLAKQNISLYWQYAEL